MALPAKKLTPQVFPKDQVEAALRGGGLVKKRRCFASPIQFGASTRRWNRILA